MLRLTPPAAESHPRSGADDRRHFASGSFDFAPVPWLASVSLRNHVQECLPLRVNRAVAVIARFLLTISLIRRGGTPRLLPWNRLN